MSSMDKDQSAVACSRRKGKETCQLALDSRAHTQAAQSQHAE
jgi:hypothetical protein